MSKKALLLSTVVGVVSAVVSAVITSMKAGKKVVEPVKVLIDDAYVQGTDKTKYMVTYTFADREVTVEVEDEDTYRYFKERVGQEVSAFVVYVINRNGTIGVSCHLLGKVFEA